MGIYFKTFEYGVIPTLLAILFIFANGTGRHIVAPIVLKIVNWKPTFAYGFRLFPLTCLFNVIMAMYHLL